MGNPSEFYLVDEKKDVKMSFETALTTVKKYGTLKKKSYKIYEIVIGHMTYTLLLQDQDGETENPVIKLESLITLHEEDVPIFFDMCFDLCRNIDPVYATGGNGIEVWDYGPAWSSIEHYRNPYFFCIEPPKSRCYVPPDFLFNENMLKKVAEISKVLSRNELLILLQVHCKKVAIGPKMGVSVFKGYTTNDAIALRYYLSKEVRKRGIQLEEGDAEQFAKKILERK